MCTLLLCCGTAGPWLQVCLRSAGFPQGKTMRLQSGHDAPVPSWRSQGPMQSAWKAWRQGSVVTRAPSPKPSRHTLHSHPAASASCAARQHSVLYCLWWGGLRLAATAGQGCARGGTQERRVLPRAVQGSHMVWEGAVDVHLAGHGMNRSPPICTGPSCMAVQG